MLQFLVFKTSGKGNLCGEAQFYAFALRRWRAHQRPVCAGRSAFDPKLLNNDAEPRSQ